MDKAKTPWGRALQQQTLKLRESAALRDTIVGSNRVARKQFVSGLTADYAKGAAVYARAQKSFDDLSRHEKIALHIVAEASRLGGDRAEWLAHRIESLKTLLDEATQEGVKKDLQAQLKHLGINEDGSINERRFNKIQDAIVNPSKKFEVAREEARGAAAKMLEDHPFLTPEQALDRVYGPGRVLHGARWKDATEQFVPGSDQFAEQRAAAQAAHDAAHADFREAEQAFRDTPRPDEFRPEGRMAEMQGEIDRLEKLIRDNGPNHPGREANEQHLRILKDLYERNTARQRQAWGRTQEARSRAYQAAEDRLHQARQRFEQAQEDLHSVPAGDTQGSIRVDPEGFRGGPDLRDLQNAAPDEVHGNPFYFPHRGPQMQTSSIIGSAKTTMPLGTLRPDAGHRLWRAMRQTTGQYMTDPSAWTRAGLSSLRWKMAADYQKWLLDNVAVHIDPMSGQLPKGYRWFQPGTDFPNTGTTRASRAAKERAGLHEGLDGPDIKHATEDSIDAAVKRMIPHGENPTLDWFQPVYAVPEKYAKAFEQEFAATHKMVRRFFDKPMDLWRAAVLKLRPAWLVNNIVGQHLLYWITANPDSILPYIRALRLEKSGHYVDNWLGRALKIPAFRNKYGAMLEDEGMVGVGYGTTHGTLGLNREDEFMAGWRGKLEGVKPERVWHRRWFEEDHHRVAQVHREGQPGGG